MSKRGSLAVSFVIILSLIVLLTTIYLIIQSEQAKTATLISIVTIIILGTIILVLQYFLPLMRLNKKIKLIKPKINQVPAAALKEEYIQIYDFYLKLSESNKHKFYVRISQLREGIEAQMILEKKIEHLLEQSVQGTISEKKKNYQVINGLFQQLSPSIQDKYYPQVNRIKEELGRNL